MVKYLLKHLKSILASGVIFALVAFMVVMFFPKYYSAGSQLLIVNRSFNSTDPYTQVKAAERIGENIAKVADTTDFYKKTLLASQSFDKQYWQTLEERDRREKWGQNVKVSMNYNSSLMNVVTYAKTKQEAVNLNVAVSQTLISRSAEYVGTDVALKNVNDPLASRFFVRPSLILSSFMGLVFGILFGILWIVSNKKRFMSF